MSRTIPPLLSAALFAIGPIFAVSAQLQTEEDRLERLEASPRLAEPARYAAPLDVPRRISGHADKLVGAGWRGSWLLHVFVESDW